VGLMASWPRGFVGTMSLAAVVAVAAWLRRWPRVTTSALALGFAAGGAAAATTARDGALHPPLRQALHPAGLASPSGGAGRAVLCDQAICACLDPTPASAGVKAGI